MKRHRAALTVVGVAILLAAGVLIASNMGFRLEYPMYGPVDPNDPPGRNTIALPFIRQVGIDNAEDLINDIETDTGGNFVDAVLAFTATNDGLIAYTGTTGVNFNLIPGEGYFVDVNSNVTYTIVGTHDPALTITFEAPGSNGSSSGYTLYAHPYHGVATTAGELMAEINAWDGGGDPVVVSVQRFVSIEDGLEVYNGFPGQTDFPLTAGQAYFIAVKSDVSFVPAHY